MVVIAGKAWNWQNLGGRIPLLNHSPWPMSSYSMNVTCGSFAPGKKKRQLDFKRIYNRSMLQVYDYLLSSYDGQVSSYPSSQLSTGGEIRIMMIRFRISSTLRIIGPTLPLRHTGSFTLPLEAPSDPQGLEQICQQ